MLERTICDDDFRTIIQMVSSSASELLVGALQDTTDVLRRTPFSSLKLDNIDSYMRDQTTQTFVVDLIIADNAFIRAANSVGNCGPRTISFDLILAFSILAMVLLVISLVLAVMIVICKTRLSNTSLSNVFNKKIIKLIEKILEQNDDNFFKDMKTNTTNQDLIDLKEELKEKERDEFANQLKDSTEQPNPAEDNKKTLKKLLADKKVNFNWLEKIINGMYRKNDSNDILTVATRFSVALFVMVAISRIMICSKSIWLEDCNSDNKFKSACYDLHKPLLKPTTNAFTMFKGNYVAYHAYRLAVDSTATYKGNDPNDNKCEQIYQRDEDQLSSWSTMTAKMECKMALGASINALGITEELKTRLRVRYAHLANPFVTPIDPLDQDKATKAFDKAYGHVMELILASDSAQIEAAGRSEILDDSTKQTILESIVSAMLPPFLMFDFMIKMDDGVCRGSYSAASNGQTSGQAPGPASGQTPGPASGPASGQTPGPASGPASGQTPGQTSGPAPGQTHNPNSQCTIDQPPLPYMTEYRTIDSALTDAHTLAIYVEANDEPKSKTFLRVSDEDLVTLSVFRAWAVQLKNKGAAGPKMFLRSDDFNVIVQITLWTDRKAWNDMIAKGQVTVSYSDASSLNNYAINLSDDNGPKYYASSTSSDALFNLVMIPLTTMINRVSLQLNLNLGEMARVVRKTALPQTVKFLSAQIAAQIAKLLRPYVNSFDYASFLKFDCRQALNLSNDAEGCGAVYADILGDAKILLDVAAKAPPHATQRFLSYDAFKTKVFSASTIEGFFGEKGLYANALALARNAQFIYELHRKYSTDVNKKRLSLKLVQELAGYAMAVWLICVGNWVFNKIDWTALADEDMKNNDPSGSKELKHHEVSKTIKKKLKVTLLVAAGIILPLLVIAACERETSRTVIVETTSVENSTRAVASLLQAANALRTCRSYLSPMLSVGSLGIAEGDDLRVLGALKKLTAKQRQAPLPSSLDDELLQPVYDNLVDSLELIEFRCTVLRQKARNSVAFPYFDFVFNLLIIAVLLYAFVFIYGKMKPAQTLRDLRKLRRIRRKIDRYDDLTEDEIRFIQEEDDQENLEDNLAIGQMVFVILFTGVFFWIFCEEIYYSKELAASGNSCS
jgi:hypothetical protein